MTDEEFLAKVESFIQLHRLSPTTFGLLARNDSRFVFDLRVGRSCYAATMTKVFHFMASYEIKQRERRLRILSPRYEDDPRAVSEGDAGQNGRSGRPIVDSERNFTVKRDLSPA